MIPPVIADAESDGEGARKTRHDAAPKKRNAVPPPTLSGCRALVAEMSNELFLRQEIEQAEKRFAHCQRVIDRQIRYIEDLHLAGDAETEQIVRDALILALRVRLAREALLLRLRELSVAS